MTATGAAAAVRLVTAYNVEVPALHKLRTVMIAKQLPAILNAQTARVWEPSATALTVVEPA